MVLRFSLMLALILAACASTNLREAVEKNPEILAKAIEEHPDVFLPAFLRVSEHSKVALEKKRNENALAQLEEQIKNPKAPAIEEKTPVLGVRGAPITIVAYSDFECPYCRVGSETIHKLLKKYSGKIAYVHKNLPLSFHKNAKPAAEVFTAIALRNPEAAYRFHDYIFANQDKLKEGDKFLMKAALKAGADLNQLKQDRKGKLVQELLQKDQAEASKFEINGTPAFLVNGVVISGAQPEENFEKVIERTNKS